ncbi:MAG TPA: EamA family transporter [Ruminococcaceae bacterium]|nr:EamA family transporter [Oscillospiraceae bacterium]
MEKLSNKTKGIICILLSAFCFSGMSSFINLSGDVPVPQKVFFRNLVALFCASAVLIKNHEPFKPIKGCLKYHFLRSSVGLLGVFGNFYATTHMAHTADAAMLNKLSPFATLIFSAIFLKEKVKPKQALAIIGAFIGAMFVIKPTLSNVELVPSLAGLIGGLSAGAAYTTVRHMANKGENGRFTVFFFSAFSVAVTAPYLIFNYHYMTGRQFLYLMLVGVCAAGGQFAITAAYSFAPSREISIYDYSNIIFTAIEGYLFLGHQIPDVLSFIGYAIICLMAVWNFFTNNKTELVEHNDKNT